MIEIQHHVAIISVRFSGLAVSPARSSSPGSLGLRGGALEALLARGGRPSLFAHAAKWELAS